MQVKTVLALAMSALMLLSASGITGVLADGASGPAGIGNSSAVAPIRLELENHTYYPNDVVRIYIHNASGPMVTVTDPSNVTFSLPLSPVNGSAYLGEYALDRSIILGNYAVNASDNATGVIVVDTFEVTTRRVSATPVPTMMPGNATADNSSLYLYINVSKADYTPGQKADISVGTNAGKPTLVIRDPANNTAYPELLGTGENAYSATFGLDKAVVLGNYTVLAYVNENGTYCFAAASFNVTLGRAADKGMRIRYAAYDPAQKAVVLRAQVASSADAAEAVKGDPAVKGMAVRSVKVLQASGVRDAPANDDKKVDVLIPVDNNNVDSVIRQYNLTPDITRATTSVAVNADGTNIRLSLDNKVDGCWYRLSAPVPSGYQVLRITRADGIEISNDIRVDRATGQVLQDDVNWYVDNGTLYFYDDPINGYDITLLPPAATSSLAVNVVAGGQLSAIVYPFNQTDSDATITANDHLGYTGDNGYANDIDADAGTKTAVRMYSNNNVNNNSRIMFGNDGMNYHTYSNARYEYADVGAPVVVGFNTVPDGSVESVIISSYRTPQPAGYGVPSYVNITQKTIIRNNNLWFATVYYINNAGAADIAGFRFYEGADFNFNGQYTRDDDFYNAASDSVYGYMDNANPSSIHVGGFRSPLGSSTHDVNTYGTVWGRISTDYLRNGTSTNNIDGGMALSWDRGTLRQGETWVVPVIWAVGQNASVFNTTLNGAVNNNVYDVGIKEIVSPKAGDSLNALTMPAVAINATAMDTGVTDQSPTVYLQIKNSSGAIVYTASAPVTLSVPYRETAPVSFSWGLSGVPAGSYNVSVYTQLAGDQNRSNDLKSITVHVRDFALYPDQWVHANPGDNVFFPLNLTNLLGAPRTFDLSISPSTARWASNLYYNNTSILLANDTTGDGIWDWVNASYRDPVSGLPAINVSASSTGRLLLQKLVPAAADTGILDTVTLTSYPSGQPLSNASAILRTDTPLAPTANKTFYLHSLSLNTTPESASAGSKPVTAIFAMWSQVPAFADSFMIAGNVSVPVYYTTTAAMPITVSLFYTDGIGSSSLIGSNTSQLGASANQAVPSMYNFTIVPSGNVTIPRGSYLVVKIDNQQTTAFNVWYTNAYRSRVDVRTPTYVHVGAINTYNGTTPVSTFIAGDTVYVTANVTDPIGAYDISGATISVSAPNGSMVVNNQTMALNGTDTRAPALWKLYNYTFRLDSSLPPGVYGINITGYESNGVISRKNLSITLISPVPALSIYPNVTTYGVPNTIVDIKHAVMNLDVYRSDVADISYTRSLIWPISLYRADGITPLGDTDGDGVPDTDTLAPLASTDIIVRVSIPSNANEGDIDLINVTARSSQNNSISAMASDAISIPNSAISIEPSATYLGVPNTVVSFNHSVTNLNVYRNDTIGITYASTPGWPVTLYKADGITPLPDTNGDGIPDTGSLAPMNSTYIIVSVTVPSYVNPGDVNIANVTAHSSLNSTVSSMVTDTVYISTSSVVKTLYLHEDATSWSMNTSMNSSPVIFYNISGGATRTWTQSPVFARDFNILDNPHLRLYVVTPDTDLIMTITLQSTDGVTTSTIGTASVNTHITSNTITPYDLDISLSGYNVTIPKGSGLILQINNGNNQRLTVHQSATYPSHIDMDTTSYVDVQSVNICDQSGGLLTATTPPSAVKVVANVTDPFGSFDISDASLSMYYDNGTRAIGPLNMNLSSTDATAPSLWKLFERNVTLNTSFDSGNYNFIVTANESNSVKDNMSAPLAITYPVHVRAVKSISPAGSNNYVAALTVTNLDTHTIRGVHVYDFYSADFTVGNFSVARSMVPVNNGVLSGTINVFGPIILAPGETRAITYNVQGSGNYQLPDMYVVGVDPYV